MKIAVLGNMNNNGFSLMRYFRDLGSDAHLLLYANDGQNALSHFSPECDTTDYSKWSDYVHRTSIANFPGSALKWPESAAVSAYMARLHKQRNESFVSPWVSNNEIRKTLAPYDQIIGSGIAPAVCHRIGRKLDVFFPYATGIEYLESPEFLAHSQRGNLFVKYAVNKTRSSQRSGILDARLVFNAETGLTERVCNSIGIKPIRLPIPIIYNRESWTDSDDSSELLNLWEWLDTRDFKLFTSTRLIWTEQSKFVSGGEKNNHWVLTALAEFKRERQNARPGFVITEYGPDVESTKRLVADLGLEENIYWLPTSPRIKLMKVLSKCDVAIGEFRSNKPRMLWGGTGWEALASGRPLIQSFQFKEGEYESLFGAPPPPMFKIWDRTDILGALLKSYDDRNHSAKMGIQAAEWFNQHNGIGLAKRWLNALASPAI